MFTSIINFVSSFWQYPQASVVSNNQIINLRETEEICLHTWIVHDKEVRLLRWRNELECLIINISNGEKWRVPFEEDSQPIEERIAALKEAEPIINEDGSLTFAAVITHLRKNGKNYGEYIEREVQLIQRGDSLMWRLFDRAAHKSSCTLVINDFDFIGAHLKECTSEIRDLFHQTIRDPSWQKEIRDQILDDKAVSKGKIDSFVKAKWLELIPLQNRISFLQDFSISKVEGDETTTKITAVSLIKISAVSRIDGKTPLDRSNWAVTILCCGRDWHGHAVIAYEGIRNGIPFLNYAHFSGLEKPGKVGLFEEGQKNWKELSFHLGKTETWQRKRQLVQKMEKFVRWEIEQQNRGKTPVVYNRFGKDSLLVQALETQGINYNYIINEEPLPEEEFVTPNVIIPHNCITWAKEVLELANISLPQGQYAYLFTTPLEYVQPAPLEQVDIRSDSISEPSIPKTHLVLTNPSENFYLEALEQQAQLDKQEALGMLEKFKEKQVKKQIELEGLKKAIQDLPNRIRDLTSDERRLAAGKEAYKKLRTRGLNNLSLLSQQEIDDISYVDRVKFQEMRNLIEERLLNFKIIQNQNLTTSLEILIAMLTALINDKQKELGRLERLFIMHKASMECMNSFLRHREDFSS